MHRGARRITKGWAVIYTLSHGKKIQKVTDMVTGTKSVVRAVSAIANCLSLAVLGYSDIISPR